MMNYQWNIFLADLNPVKGSEQKGIRPVLVISEEVVNQTLPIVTILAITSFKKGRNIYPIEYLSSELDFNTRGQFPCVVINSKGLKFLREKARSH